MHPCFVRPSGEARRVHLVGRGDWDKLAPDLPDAVRSLAQAFAFDGSSGQIVHVADAKGRLTDILYGLGEARDAMAVAGLSAQLPEGLYEIAACPAGTPFHALALAWADGAYRFERYKPAGRTQPQLVVPPGIGLDAIHREAAAIDGLRDLVNTPASDMGPDGIEAAIRQVARQHDAEVASVIGDDLLTQNYPMIHAVGRAAAVAPRLVELSWGNPDHPRLAIVGKGVAFDSGGLNIKTGNGMRIMKKDMGGAAHAIALASLVMDARLPVHLKLYVPAVENAIAGNAFRPGDVLRSRKGKTVEIDNTDAEGRLILADALARASEGDPDLIVDFATLTGAARVALGPDLAPFYTDDDLLAAAIAEASLAAGDPAWRMPLWQPYIAMLSSPVADLANSGGSMAGSITAALFLKEFVEARSWVHLDIWAWREAKHGRPAGAAACGLRALWHVLRARYTTG